MAEVRPQFEPRKRSDIHAALRETRALRRGALCRGETSGGDVYIIFSKFILC